MALIGVLFSLVLIADAFRNTIYADATNGLTLTIARGHLRSETYRFVTQVAFLATAVSFVTSSAPIPAQSPAYERVALFTLGAFFILVNSLDSYLTNRRLLRRG